MLIRLWELSVPSVDVGQSFLSSRDFEDGEEPRLKGPVGVGSGRHDHLSARREIKSVLAWLRLDRLRLVLVASSCAHGGLGGGGEKVAGDGQVLLEVLEGDGECEGGDLGDGGGVASHLDK